MHEDRPVFFVDLDHTLIYSHRVAIDAPRRVVEYWQGEPLSYMTERTFAYLSRQQDVLLLPVTTRTQEQYERIEVFRQDIACHFALVCNGGLLLCDGQRDKDWLEETERLVDPSRHDLQQMARAAAQIPDVEIRWVEDMFFYFLHDEPQRYAEMIRREVPSDQVEVLTGGRRKIYCVPRILNKGTAVRRFCRRFHRQASLAAGDSAFDLPMLRAVDTAFVLPKYAAEVSAPDTVVLEELVLSDGICHYLEEHGRRKHDN